MSRKRRSWLALGASAFGALVILVTGILLLTNSGPHVHLDSDPGSTPLTATTNLTPEGQDGYVAPADLDSTVITPPPPAPGSPRAEADRKVFLATRTLAGSPRWALAASDNDQSIGATLTDFSCATGVALDAATAPAIVHLFTRLTPDAARTINAAKRKFDRKRPFLVDSGPICTPKTDELVTSPDYPSGHSSWGWMSALLLAEMAPDRANQILVRGRAYGESRVICGVHTPSAVDAGRVDAAALVATLHGKAAFRADLEAARAELAMLRGGGHSTDPGACAAQARLTSGAFY